MSAPDTQTAVRKARNAALFSGVVAGIALAVGLADDSVAVIALAGLTMLFSLVGMAVWSVRYRSSKRKAESS